MSMHENLTDFIYFLFVSVWFVLFLFASIWSGDVVVVVSPTMLYSHWYIPNIHSLTHIFKLFDMRYFFFFFQSFYIFHFECISLLFYKYMTVTILSGCWLVGVLSNCIFGCCWMLVFGSTLFNFILFIACLSLGWE